jgi:hypothetical protein
VLRPEDLLFRCRQRRWLFVAPLSGLDPSQYLSRAEKLLADSNRNRPGRPLPPVRLEVAGQWGLAEQRDLERRLQRLLDAEEVLVG